MQNILYHYCSLDTFMKIIETKTLRLSEIEKSNDYMELVWLKGKIIPEIIKQRYKKKFGSTPLVYKFEGISTKGAEGIIKMLEWFCDREGQDKMFESFTLACCLSESGDLLSQWRGYADNARGISLGMDRTIFEKVFKIPCLDENTISPINFDKIKYVDENLYLNNIIFNSELEVVVKVVDEFLNNLQRTNDDNLKHIITEFLYSVSILAPIYKNSAFSEEKEWRAYINYLYPSNENPNENLVKEHNEIVNKSSFSNLKAYIRNNKTVFYTEFNWQAFNLIKEIYIGPKCKIDENDIKKLLFIYNIANGENITITKSKCSYM